MVPDLFYDNKCGGGLTIDPFYITRNTFGTSLAAIRCETLTVIQDDILSRDMSKLFLAQKSSQLNGNTFYHFLVAGFTFMILTPLGTSFLQLEISR